MTSKRIFQCSLALPILVPLLVMPLWLVRDSINENSIVGLILIVIAFSGIVGGIPYLILTVALLIWMRDKELPSIRRAILLSPLMMIPIYAFCLGVYVLIFERDPSLGEYFIGLFFYGAFIPIFGYAYVGVAFGLEKLLRAE